jgi:hypothetical protein
VFRRLVFENNAAAFFTIAAFITAVSIYVMISWRALRMKRSQVERFENLPFEIETPAATATTAAIQSNAAATPHRRSRHASRKNRL